MTPIVKGFSVLEIVIKRDSRLGEHWSLVIFFHDCKKEWLSYIYSKATTF